MNDSPGENRVTDDPTGLSCRKGRPGGTLWQASSSPLVSPSERKNVPTDYATRQVTNPKRPNTGEYGFVLVPTELVGTVPTSTSYSLRNSQLRKPARPARRAGRYVEVGGSGGNGRRQPAAPGPGDGKFFSGSGRGGGAYYILHLRESNPAKESIGSQRALGGGSL